MKKFLIAIIFIIPILVVTAIGATGNIIASTKQVNATSMLLRDEKNELIKTEVPITLDLNNAEGKLIIVEVLPKITYNKDVVYQLIKDDNHTGDVALKQIAGTDRYKIIPIKSGNVRIVIRASNNREIYKALEIYVKTEMLDGINIHDEDGKTLASGSEHKEININAPKNLYAYVYPIEAMYDKNIVWHSDNTEIATVTPNGTVYPISAGRVRVTASATDKMGNRLEQYLVVNTKTMVAKAENIYVNAPVDSHWIAQNVALNKDSQVTRQDTYEHNGAQQKAVQNTDKLYPKQGASSGETSILHGASSGETSILHGASSGETSILQGASSGETSIFIISYGGYSQRVVVNVCQPKDWDLFDVPTAIYANNGAYQLNAKYLTFGDESGITGVKYAIEGDAAVCSITGNDLNPKRFGEVTLVASFGGQQKRLQITVKERLTNFNISLNKEDSELGIEMTRVWGQKFINNEGTLVNTYKVSSSIKEGQADLIWETDNSDYATVDNAGIITFYPDSAGHTVKVSAKILVNNYPVAERSYEFNMVKSQNSINVCRDTGDYESDRAFSSDMFYKMYNEQKGAALILQQDILALDKINLTASLYGNGFMIDAQDYQHGGTFSDLIYIADGNIQDKNSVLQMKNLTIQGAASFDASDKSNRGIRVDGVTMPVEIKYNCVRYFNVGIDIRNNPGEVFIEGCVLGDCYFSGISLSHTPPSDCPIVIKNSIAKETNGPAIFATHNEFLKEQLNQNIFPKVRIEGFFDSYNWKTPDELVKMLNALDPSLLGAVAEFIDPKVVTDALGKVLRDLFLREDMVRSRYTMKLGNNKEQIYVNLGMFVLGAFNKIDASNMTLQDSGLEFIEVKMPKDETMLGQLVKFFNAAVTLFSSKMTIMHSSYILTYDVQAEGGPRNKPGDPVPQDTQLYRKLNGKILVDGGGIRIPEVTD